MTSHPPQPVIALLGKAPADVQAALKDRARLLTPGEWSALRQGERAAIDRALTTAMIGVDPAMVAQLPGLRRIVSIGAGVDLVDEPWLEGQDISFHPTPEVMTEDTADCAIALMFACLRNTVANDRFVRQGHWAKGRASLGMRPSSARVGIVGLGRIGLRIAQKLSAFGCEVGYASRSAKDVPWHFERSPVRLADWADVVILSCAGGAETRHLAGAKLLAALGPQGYLVNVARGSVVDEGALIAALGKGTIAGAALDVFDNEPLPDPRFLDLTNCVLSPHAAVYTRENRVDLIARVKDLLQVSA